MNDGLGLLLIAGLIGAGVWYFLRQQRVQALPPPPLEGPILSPAPATPGGPVGDPEII